MIARPSVVIPAKAGIQLWALTMLFSTLYEARADNILTRPVPPVLVGQVECMARALKSLPDVDHVKSHVERVGGMVEASVVYRDNSKAGERATLGFKAEGLEPPFFFQIILGGLYGGNMRGPKDYGVQRIEDLWKKKCGVSAAALFF